MKNILLSVIIPTKDRYTTLVPVVTSLLKYIDSDNVEFIIQDNSEIKEDLGNLLLDDRVIYSHTPNPISIKENTTAAISKIKGEYTIFIGDDDLLSPYIIDIVKSMKEKNMNCLIYNAAYYWWDSVDFVNETYYHKKKAFWEPMNLNLEFIKKDSEKELENVLVNGAVGMLNLARYYHGIIKTSLLFEIKNKTGQYLNGSSPDMGFAVSLNLTIKNYFFINFPVSIYGASKNSGGGWTAAKKHYGKIEEQKHLPLNIKEVWDEKIPYIWSETSIYGQTASEILKKFERKEKINYTALYATMLANEPYLFSYIKPKLVSHFSNTPFTIISFFKYYAKRKIGNYLRNQKYKNQKMEYKVSLIDNVDSLMSHMKNNSKYIK
ncbi:glycosyltransferase [Chryseobacterium gotjawalense]|uniref:Glycosyltransferase n=1 Tax=Chryseobacterium gotjawalense TaxID=3042315 RepID=A0ABY8RGE9_9FLAO|nr:glycosyltransferase [Chryseobacterium sp. wdc7]WHF53057.1 glycosyltransferase [Chryseobacterium sp. wdc7]